YAPKHLLKLAPKKLQNNSRTARNIKEAVILAQKLCRQGEHHLVCITGSFYLIAEYLRDVLKLKKI
ncbi:MAG: hypothetical protein WC838_05940, partial [Candidatus Margulisiibacteriota bacterium]